ncbi:MAG: Do family serine endopeptidase [Salaquimonas sp.]
MRFLLTLLIAISFNGMIFANSTHAQSSIEDIFKKSIDELLGKGKDSNQRAERDPLKRVPEGLAEVTLSFAPIVKKATPSVVNVYAAKKVQQRVSPFEGDPFFEHLFGKNGPFQQPRPRVKSSLGSGVIVGSEGIILTNNHVIAGADEVKISLHDGSEYEAEIILKDEKSDLAVLKVTENATFEAIEIADSEEVEVGDLVLAIGNPFGVGQTVTSGIVSAIARSRVGINDFDFFIQTDAAINPGNSGGALVDMQGRLVGINTAIYSRSGGSNGIGFAIPSNMVQVIIRSAVSGEAMVTRPWIGADFQEVTAEIAESLGMKRPGGVLVASVFEDGPADKAGLKPGDVVIGINQKVLQNNDALAYRLDTIGIGNDAELVVISGLERKVVTLRLMEAPESTPRDDTRIDAGAVLGGALVANLSPAVAQQVGVSSTSDGVIVLDVPRRTRAEANGVRKGDIIVAINGIEVKDVADVVSITSKESRRGWQVLLERAGRQLVFERKGSFFRQYRP